MSFRSRGSGQQHSTSRVSMSSYISSSDVSGKHSELSALSKESLSDAESPTLAAYPSARKEKGTSKLKLFRKSAVKLADDLGRKSGYRGPAGRRESASGLTQQQMAMYEPGTFDLQGMTEKGIDQLRADLAAVDADCADQIRKTVHDNYHHFIQACQGIAKLEGEMQAVRALLGNSSNIIAALREMATPSGAARNTAGEASSSGAAAEWQESPEGQNWAEVLEDLDIAIAERRCEDAVQLLQKADASCTHPQAIDWSDPEHQTRYDRIEGQQEKVDQRRVQLSSILEARMKDPNTKSGERRSATSLMAAAVSKAWAHQQLLEAHTAQLTQLQELLSRPQNAGGGDADGVEYANALAQASFRAVAVAATDVAIVFQKDAPELSSLFLVWALQETQRCARLLLQNALSPFAVPAGLDPTVHCCTLALLYCTALETSHSLMLSPRLMSDLWPTCEQVLQRRLRRLTEDLRREVAAEVDGLASLGSQAQGPPSGWDALTQTFPSANRLVSTVQSTVSILRPLAGPKPAQVLRRGVADLFQTYTNALSASFQKHQQPDGSFPYNLDMMDEMQHLCLVIHMRGCHKWKSEMVHSIRLAINQRLSARDAVIPGTFSMVKPCRH
ncbi:hypothetical protein WJX82_002404 [Trebouxia sp. C0006]